MRKQLLSLFAFIAGVTLLLTSCDKTSNQMMPVKSDFSYLDLAIPFSPVNSAPGVDLTIPLIAGKNEQVGNVIVKQAGDKLLISFVLDKSGWVLNETHLSVTASLDDVPGYLENSNPKIGNFNCNNLPRTGTPTSFIYEPITIPRYPDNKTIFILAHGVVSECKTNWAGLNSKLPTSGILKSVDRLGDLSYLISTIEEADYLTGEHLAWCIDLYHNTDGLPYNIKFISSYDPNLSTLGLLKFPGNMDLINWILNQNFVNKQYSEGQIYTFGDVQSAIWRLSDGVDVTASALGPTSADRVDAILDAASFHEGYVPGCGEKVAIVLQPVDPTTGISNNKQITIIMHPLECCDCENETVWAAGYSFPGNSWAMWFKFLAL